MRSDHLFVRVAECHTCCGVSPLPLDHMLSNLSSDFPNAQESSERDHLLRPFVDREGVNLARIVGVEATPRAGYAGNALHGKTVVYIDNQMWFNPYVDSYDSSGHLWQNHIYWMTYRDRPLPDAQIAIYPFKREFVLGAAATDVQTGAATMCYLPDRNSPERETW